jgi:hypothetical protein
MSFKNEGHEVYVENISMEGAMSDYYEVGLRRLDLVRKAMPLGEWTLWIEQETRNTGIDGDRFNSFDSMEVK